MKEKMIQISIRKKEHDYLVKQKGRLRKRGFGAVIESMVNLIKHLKLEGEMR